MKIGQITKHYFPITGGQQTYIQNLIEVFSRNNIQSTIFQPYAPGAKQANQVVVTSFIPLLQRLDRYFHNIGWFLFNFELKLFKKKISDQDIIISHYSFHFNPVRWHNRVIILSHGVLWSARLKTFFDKVLHRMDMQVKNHKDIFIVANDTDFLRRVGIPASEGEGFFQEIAPRKWFIPNCIDDSYFCPEPSIEKEKMIIVPRNIRPDRGIDLAIRAFSIFSKQFPDYQLKIIGGPLKGKYFNFCENLVVELGMQGKIIFTGSCDWKSMRDHYRKATLTLIPTLEKEGTSLSALESMGCGTPVVGTNVAGLRDLPIVKAEPKPENVAEKLIETLHQADQIRIQQLNAIKTIFNLANWEKAWLNVVKKVYNTQAL